MLVLDKQMSLKNTIFADWRKGIVTFNVENTVLLTPRTDVYHPPVITSLIGRISLPFPVMGGL